MPEPDRRLGAALGADHPGRARARALAEGVALEQHDVAEAGAAQEPRRPGADRPAADDDGVRVLLGTVVMLLTLA